MHLAVDFFRAHRKSASALSGQSPDELLRLPGRLGRYMLATMHHHWNGSPAFMFALMESDARRLIALPCHSSNRRCCIPPISRSEIMGW